jgi:uncharacterized protein (TIGR03067 family)
MRSKIAMISIALVLVSATRRDEDHTKVEMNKLQGTWTKVLHEADGNPDLDFEVDLNGFGWKPMPKSTIVVKGARVSAKNYIPRYDKPETFTLTYQLDAKTPGTMEITHTDSKGKKTTVQAIYLLVGDVLMICWSGDGKRPKDFVSKRGSKTSLLIFKRGKPWDGWPRK